jgi:hypothetical protein
MLLAKNVLSSIVKAAANQDNKPHSTEAKVTAANNEILDKLNMLLNLAAKPDYIRDTFDLELNRVQAKVFVASMVTVMTIQTNVLDAYNKKLDSDFSNEPGRTKEDYIVRLKARMASIQDLLTKVRKEIS